MKQVANNIYEADEGKMFVRISDGIVFGDVLDLGPNDSIGNYEEQTFTDEEREEFWNSIGRIDPKKIQHHEQ